MLHFYKFPGLCHSGVQLYHSPNSWLMRTSKMKTSDLLLHIPGPSTVTTVADALGWLLDRWLMFKVLAVIHPHLIGHTHIVLLF